MNREALDILPAVLDSIGFQRGLLLGHSDGASIAAIYAGGTGDHRVRGVVMLAPHFVVEDVSVASIAEIKRTYQATDLRAKLARWHRDVDRGSKGRGIEGDRSADAKSPSLQNRVGAVRALAA